MRTNCAVDLILTNNADDQEMGDMSDQEIKEGITELLFAGHETISSVFTASIMHLHNHPGMDTKMLIVYFEKICM